MHVHEYECEFLMQLPQVRPRLQVWLLSRPGLILTSVLILVVLCSHVLQRVAFVVWLMVILGLAGVIMLLAPLIPGG